MSKRSPESIETEEFERVETEATFTDWQTNLVLCLFSKSGLGETKFLCERGEDFGVEKGSSLERDGGWGGADEVIEFGSGAHAEKKIILLIGEIGMLDKIEERSEIVDFVDEVIGTGFMIKAKGNFDYGDQIGDHADASTGEKGGDVIRDR